MFSTLVSFENNKANVERLLDSQEKKNVKKRQKIIKNLLHFFILHIKKINHVLKDFINKKWQTKKNQEFQRLIISYNNVLS